MTTLLTDAEGAGPAPAGEAAVLPLTAAQSGMWFAQSLDPLSPAQNTADVLVTEALVAADLADAQHDLADQLGEGGLRGHLQAQRQYVHHHARHTERDRPDPAHHGQAEHDLPVAGRP